MKSKKKDNGNFEHFFLLTATIIKYIHVSVVYLSVHLSVRLYVHTFVSVMYLPNT